MKTQKTQKITGGFGNSSDKTPEIRSRKWVFTLNNWTIDEYEKIKHIITAKNWKYIIGKEVGEKCGTPHLQGYIEHKNDIKNTTLYNIMPRAHYEPAKGNISKNYDYCSKIDRGGSGDFITNIEKPKEKRRTPLTRAEIKDKLFIEWTGMPYLEYKKKIEKEIKIHEELYDNRFIREEIVRKESSDEETEHFYHDWE